MCHSDLSVEVKYARLTCCSQEAAAGGDLDREQAGWQAAAAAASRGADFGNIPTEGQHTWPTGAPACFFTYTRQATDRKQRDLRKQTVSA